MQRITVTLDDALVAALDRVVATRGYQNRSEAIRDLARAGISQALDGEAGDSIGALVYVYNHETREMAKRLARAFHEHHDLSLASMHVHLDHANCLEVTLLRGKTRAVRRLADHVIAERGVRHGRLVLVPVAAARERHAHGAEPERPHLHLHVRESS